MSKSCQFFKLLIKIEWKLLDRELTLLFFSFFVDTSIYMHAYIMQTQFIELALQSFFIGSNDEEFVFQLHFTKAIGFLFSDFFFLKKKHFMQRISASIMKY